MRKRGYNAQPDPRSAEAPAPPARAEGRARYIGKDRLLISERNGPSQRIAAIYTNLELPYTDSRAEKYSWIPEFCEICNRCVRTCPAKAIHLKPRVTPDGRKEYVDCSKCVVVFSRTLGCEVCIKECTFFKGDFEKVRKAYENYKKVAAKRTSALKTAA
jgi:epoxyqueuosine reductase QueG